jgi:ribosomal protein L5
MSTQTAAPPARLKARYLEEIRPALMERFGYTSVMQAPKIEKITVNMGVGDAKQDSKALEAAQEQLATIAGQKPNVRRARKSIANFKLREGMPVHAELKARAAAAAEAAHHEELRAKAEAEQAALEQLKEENPEAYEKPPEEPAEETEEEAD